MWTGIVALVLCACQVKPKPTLKPPASPAAPAATAMPRSSPPQEPAPIEPSPEAPASAIAPPKPEVPLAPKLRKKPLVYSVEEFRTKWNVAAKRLDFPHPIDEIAMDGGPFAVAIADAGTLVGSVDGQAIVQLTYGLNPGGNVLIGLQGYAVLLAAVDSSTTEEERSQTWKAFGAGAGFEGKFEGTVVRRGIEYYATFIEGAGQLFTISLAPLSIPPNDTTPNKTAVLDSVETLKNRWNAALQASGCTERIKSLPVEEGQFSASLSDEVLVTGETTASGGVDIVSYHLLTVRSDKPISAKSMAGLMALYDAVDPSMTREEKEQIKETIGLNRKELDNFFRSIKVRGLLYSYQTFTERPTAWVEIIL